MPISQLKIKTFPATTVYVPSLEGGSRMILGGAGSEGKRMEYLHISPYYSNC